MAQASKKRKSVPRDTGQFVRNAREAGLIALALIAVYLFIALLTYDAADPGWSQAVPVHRVHNSGGVVGAWLADALMIRKSDAIPAALW